MRTMMSLGIMLAVFILAGMTYAAGTEVNGDFRVTAGSYYYQGQSFVYGQLTPRCPCDISSDSNCGGGFSSIVDLGETCYDWAQFCSPGCSPVSYPYTRTVSSNFWVTPSGEVYMPTPGTGILLRNSGGLCYRITVDNNGGLVSTPTACPEE